MENKIKDLLSQIDNKDKQLINDFINIVKSMHLNDEYKVQGLIYFLLYRHKLTEEEATQKYPESIKNVKILLKLDNINYSLQATEAENLRKMFFAITKDIRIIMVKIAYVLSDLRNCQDQDQTTKNNLARGILDLFAPLAARLGLSLIKAELENGAFEILHPEIIQKIQKQVDDKYHKRQPIVNRLEILVKNCMSDLRIQGKVYGRKKHIYSIYKKLKDHPIDEVYDLIAVRAIVKTVSDCYALLGRLHSKLEPMEKRFKDYISTPKPNGYQSLHTTVIFENYPVEIQIRTEEMHKFAEYGIAAHWMYKEKRSKRDTLDVQLAWIRQMMDNDVSIDELAESLSQDIYNNEIFVQSPKGKVIYLPSGSSTLDFAYTIHSEVGNKCVGAKINGKMVPINTKLNNGDMVEIITNPNSKGPSRDWLKYCKTSKATGDINSFFKKNMRDENIRFGKSMLENAVREKGYSASKLLTGAIYEDCIKYYNVEEDEFLANVGTNAISARVVANKLIQAHEKIVSSTQTKKIPDSNISVHTPSDKHILVKGLNNALVSFAGCCHPLFGDEIIGFVSSGRGIIIHRAICPNVSYFKAERLINVSWRKIEEKQTKSKKHKTKQTLQ